ncbi:hypothetical protein PFISCL1PPCAC_29117 [Pristionchus fissidentatus]|uniref:G protein-coupled receptor n=1 Tax=Pristionchus fissidentatus TaxID=1538716 RepID=A0AAV5X200_9BILA|nr:hypothetical protein PFISCL1PPCAC_7793 [Pristionchus fissidentatus]GMT37820.1 hypothetical protein PFISCL1PPCAC_29117 [Pristionchus fissidentatus]
MAPDTAEAAQPSTYDKCPGAKSVVYPDSADFLRMLASHPTTMLPLLIITTIVYVVILSLSTKMLRNAAKIRDEQIRSDLYLCLSTPIVVSSICLQGMFIPRSVAGMSTISLAYVMFAVWRCVSLLFRMYGDSENMSELMIQSDIRLPLHSIPLCCCPCLPSLEPTVEKIDTLKFFVLQTPVVRMICVVLINTIKVESYCETTLATKILSWGGLASTLIAVYSSSIFVKMSNDHLRRYHLDVLIKCTNLTQFMYNVLRMAVDQTAMAPVFLNDIVFDDGTLIEARVQADFWYNALLIFTLALIAFSLNSNIRPGKSALFDIEPSPLAGRQPIIGATRNCLPFYGATELANEETILI